MEIFEIIPESFLTTQTMAISRSEFARSISDPDKMMMYIDTGMSYIQACKTRLFIDKMWNEMGVISRREFKERAAPMLENIRFEAADIRIYIASAPFRDKFCTASGDQRPSSIEGKLSALLLEIHDMLGEYKELLNLPEI